MTDPNASSESAAVAAILVQRSRGDKDALLEDLVEMLSGAVPGVQVERSLFRRNIKAVRLPLAGYVYLLKRAPNGSFEAARQQEVRGVVVRTVPMEIDAFLAELGLALDAELSRTERGKAALAAWLSSSSS